MMFLCAKCWCLSYVFSAFGLFSYCLPGLFGSSASRPVGCFLALLGCWSSVHVFVCLYVVSSCIFLSAIQSHSSEVTLPFRFYIAFFALCSHAIVLLPVTAFIFVRTSVWFEFFFFFVLSGYLFINLSVLCFAICLEFSVSFELHFQSVLSCICMIVSRPQWRTS